MFQVAIAIAAVSVLAKRRRFWYVALISSVVGVGFLGQGLISMKKLQGEKVAEAQETKESARPSGSAAGETACCRGTAAKRPGSRLAKRLPRANTLPPRAEK